MTGSTEIAHAANRSTAPDSGLVVPEADLSNGRGPIAAQWRARILLVEDDESVLDTFARMLRLEGYDVRTSATPERGLQEAERSRPDAIILDFRMPLLDGLGFLRQLRLLQDQRETPVAIVTGDYFLDDHVTRELHELGAEVLFKPMWLEQLVDLARKLVAQHHDHRASA
jgi:DNA-binding response OmpR family regulator